MEVESSAVNSSAAMVPETTFEGTAPEVAQNGSAMHSVPVDANAVVTEQPTAHNDQNVAPYGSDFPAGGETAKQEAMGGAAGAPNPLLEKYEEYWKCVRENAEDFQSWTYLLMTVERLDELPKIREVFDAFLAEYPLCYGYWKKYADAELRHGDPKTAAEVYARGVESVPYSVDLWGHYVTFKQSQPDSTPYDIRRLFEQGVAYVGMDYLGNTLWDKYLQYEVTQDNARLLPQIYARILGCPLKELNTYYQSFTEYVGQLTAEQLMTQEDIDAFRSELEQRKAGGGVSAAQTEQQENGNIESPQKAEETGDKADEGDKDEEQKEQKEEKEEEEQNEDQTMEDAQTPGKGGEEGGNMDVEPRPPGSENSSIEVSDEEVKFAWVETKEAIYEATKAELDRRRPYEECIKRPYFHVKPLDAVQLQTWSKYLDYVESTGDENSIVTLYERCLVACACYPEFWARYVRYLEKTDIKLARGALQRATLVYCKRKSDMHIFAANFEERHGNAEDARKAFKHVQTEVAPRLLSMIVQFANFERRQGNVEAACSIYEQSIEEELSQDETSETCAFLCIQCAYFLYQVGKDHVKGRAVLDKALDRHPGCCALWEGAIHFEESIWRDDSLERVLELYEKATKAPADESVNALAEKHREELSKRYAEFVDMHCDVKKRAEVDARHASLFPFPSSVSESRKRGGDDQPLGGGKAQKGMFDATASSAQAAGMAQMGQAGLAASQAGNYYQAPAQQQQMAQQYAQYAQYWQGYGGYTGYGY